MPFAVADVDVRTGTDRLDVGRDRGVGADAKAVHPGDQLGLSKVLGRLGHQLGHGTRGQRDRVALGGLEYQLRVEVELGFAPRRHNQPAQDRDGVVYEPERRRPKPNAGDDFLVLGTWVQRCEEVQCDPENQRR